MEKTSKELLKEFVNSQHFTSTTDIMNSMKELFSDVLQSQIVLASQALLLTGWICFYTKFYGVPWFQFSYGNL